jgi:transposase
MQATSSADYKALYEQSQLEINYLKIRLGQLEKMIFGSKAERFIPADKNDPQLSLNIAADATAICNIVSAQKITYTRQQTQIEQKQLQHPGRMKLPSSLRREEIIIEPSEDLTGHRKMGEEITEVLDYIPGELYVKQYKRIKYAKPNNAGVIIGELPPRPLDKAMAGEGLLAQVVIDKYVDHLPLYRQMQRFERSGVKLAYSTLTDWVSGTCKLIAPLYEALKKEVLACNYLHADETPIKVLDKDKKGQTHRGFYWVYHNSTKKIVFFDYQEGRGREGPVEILENFTGYLQTDGYSAYEIFDNRDGVVLMHCMAHARRLFNEALDNDQQVATYALQEIQKLYAIERKCKEQQLSLNDVKILRQKEAKPILEALGRWMKEKYVDAIKKSKTGEALAYSIKRWDRLSKYIEDGTLNIDNNPVENSIRPVAIGKKNYLFMGSHEAARRSAMLYSLLGTCKMHGVEPYAWLKSVLTQITTHPINRIKELLPHASISSEV